jgi:hypothetical protein
MRWGLLDTLALVLFTGGRGIPGVISGVVFHVDGIAARGLQHGRITEEGFWIGPCVTITTVLGGDTVP